MTSIPHYEDLSVGEIYDSLDLNWLASEKLDGTSLVAGLDEHGQFFTKRKGGEPVYDVEDWPDEIWAGTYRRAHTAVSCLIEALVKENAISNGNHIGFEILEGTLPNAIFYLPPIKDVENFAVATHTNWTPSTALFDILGSFVASGHAITCHTTNGRDISMVNEPYRYRFMYNNTIGQDLIKSRLRPSAMQTRMVLDSWLPEPSDIPGFTKREVLEISLTKKHPNAGDRNWNDLKKELVKERARLREAFNSLALLFKDAAIRVIVNETYGIMGPGSYSEGAVVQTPNGTFKLVDREAFMGLNRFVHWVKYAIVGGRRPARPSFLSRTKNWPKEKRLARLDELLTRYREGRYELHYSGRLNGRTVLSNYSGDLHQRTLNMFADTRKRIENGR